MGPIGYVRSSIITVDFAIPFPLAAALNSLSGIKIPAHTNLGIFVCNSCLTIYIRFLLITSGSFRFQFEIKIFFWSQLAQYPAACSRSQLVLTRDFEPGFWPGPTWLKPPYCARCRCARRLSFGVRSFDVCMIAALPYYILSSPRRIVVINGCLVLRSLGEKN